MLKLGLILILFLVSTLFSYVEASDLTITLGKSKMSCAEKVLKKSSASAAYNYVCTLKGRDIKEALVLENPARLVLDLKKVAGDQSKTQNLNGFSALKSVRAGVHPDKYRLVFDFDQSFTYQTKNAKGLLSLSIATNGVAIPEERETALPVETPTAVAANVDPVLAAIGVETKNNQPTARPTEIEPEPTPALKATPQATPEKIAKPTATPIATATPKATPSPKPTPTPKPTPIPATPTPKPTAEPEVIEEVTEEPTPEPEIDEDIGVSDPDIQELRQIQFGSESASTLVELKLNQKPAFTFSRKGNRTYLLVISGSTVKANLHDVPFFAPGQLEKITFVLARKEANAVHVTIGVERNVELAALSDQTSIKIMEKSKR